MDHLRDGIGLRGYGQKDPKQEYKKEGFNLFVTTMARVTSNVVQKLMATSIRRPEELEEIEAADIRRHEEELAAATARHGGAAQPLSSPGLAAPPEPAVLAEQECPCGSGKKFSECHGTEEDDALAV